MERFEIQWRSSTGKDLRKLPSQEVPKIIAAVEQLADGPFPHGVEKLSGAEHTYRIRIGDYRVVYEVLVKPEDRRNPTSASPEGCLSVMKRNSAAC